MTRSPAFASPHKKRLLRNEIQGSAQSAGYVVLQPLETALQIPTLEGFFGSLPNLWSPDAWLASKFSLPQAHVRPLTWVYDSGFLRNSENGFMMTTDAEKPQNQQSVIERLLNDEQVLVHVNPHFAGVVLPPHLLENKSVTLRLSRFFRGSLTSDEQGVTAELLFGSTYFSCFLPWGSIWGASSVSGEEYLWSDAAPDQILELYLAEKARANVPPKAPPPEARRTAPGVKRNVSHLRRVK